MSEKKELGIIADLSDINVDFIYELNIDSRYEEKMKNIKEKISDEEVDAYFKQFGID